MRLGQLARKLSLRPAQIIEFLALQNIQIEDSSNARIEDSHVLLVVQKFAPESLEKIVEEADEVEVIEEIPPIENNQSVVEEPVPQVQSEETKVVDEVEVIRVPKIELSGLKVLGKIELPEPKKKESTPEQVDNVNSPSVTEEEPSTEQKPMVQKPKGKKTHAKRERSKQGEWKNPLEQQRERETREAQEKKRMEIEQEKEKRKKHYQQKVKATTQPKRVKPAKEESAKVKPANTTQPKTWVGKFWKWLRSD